MLLLSTNVPPPLFGVWDIGTINILQSFDYSGFINNRTKVTNPKKSISFKLIHK